MSITNKTIGAAILLSLALMYIPIPFINGNAMGSLIILISGVLLLIK
jgi:hypothetical protein